MAVIGAGRRALRWRLTVSALLGALVALAALVVAFNLILDARLRGNVDRVLRERAAAVLRTLNTVDGRLAVPEALDRRASDTPTWIFAAGRELEAPAAVDPRNATAARRLGALGDPAVLTVSGTATRVLSVPVVQRTRRLGTVVVSQSLANTQSSMRDALLGSVILGLLVLAGVGALSRWLIGRALGPVARMTAEAADWGAHDLSRRFVAGAPHDELTRLAATFDRLLDRLSESLRRERRLTAEISHELRTPLARILAEVELAASRERTPDQYRATLELVRRSAQDLQRVLETLLASASGQSPRPAAEPADVATALRRAAAHLPGHAARIDIRASESVGVSVDGHLVERILAPVLDNAMRHARTLVLAELYAPAESGPVRVRISDDGPGIDPAHREQIFRSGFRLDGDSRHPGAGLGLALARRLAREAGGDVELVDGERGAAFEVRLPAADRWPASR